MLIAPVMLVHPLPARDRQRQLPAKIGAIFVSVWHSDGVLMHFTPLLPTKRFHYNRLHKFLQEQKRPLLRLFMPHPLMFERAEHKTLCPL
jgi:hypothetical protein